MRSPAALVVALVALLTCTSAGIAAPSTVQLRTFRFVDASRRAHFRNGTSTTRVLVTEVRYPSGAAGPLPLIVFAHGFAVTPDDYVALLDTWARAGYVVAAPAFPVERPGAPGGADRADLDNEPGDMSFLISRLTAPNSPLRGLVDPRRIAVAGQSDGGVAALSVAYDRRYRDRRIDAAIVMSGAAALGFSQAPAGSPPLLAVQGTVDPLNPPNSTTYYFRRMRRPKFLLWLEGAPHKEEYTTADRWAPVVRRATTAFLDHALRGAPLSPLLDAGTRPGLARIVSEP